jgi:hypothetical protein
LCIFLQPITNTSSVFAATIQAVRSSGFTYGITHVNNPVKWQQDLRCYWLAFLND